MTAQEQQMLQGLIERINQTQLPEKDTDAEAMLQNTLGRNPDALYILAQTVLVQQYALDQAQKQIADLRAQADQLRQAQLQAPAPAKHTSFLGSLLGRDDEPQRQAPPPPPPSQSQYTPVPSYPVPPYIQPMQYGQPMPYGQPVAYGAPQGGGFLRSAAQTAAGVAAGALAFEGIESLMHGFGHAAGYGPGIGSGFGGASFGEGAPREEVINNYYGDATPGGEHEHHEFDSDRFTSPGSSDSRDSGSSFLGNLNDRTANDTRLTDTAYTGGNNEQDLTGSDWNTGSSSDSLADSGQFDPADDSSGSDDSSSDFDSGGGIDSSSDFDSGSGDSY